MKPLYYFLAVFLLAASCLSAQDKYIPKKVYTTSDEIVKAIMESHTPVNSKDDERTVVTRKVLDNGYVLETRMGQYWDGSNWVNSSLDHFTYTPEGLEEEAVSQMWNNNQWENSRRFVSTYNTSGLRTRYGEMEWNGTDWANTYEYVSVYNNDNQLVEYDVQSWGGAAWDSLYKYTYTYTPSGNLETEVDLTYNGTGWDGNYRYTYQYNSNDNVSEKLEEQWMTGEWTNSILDVYTYNPQNQLELDASFWWPDTAWKASVEIYYGYNGDGFVNDILTKFWESEELGLQNKYHVTYEYIPGTDIQTDVEHQEWDLQSSEWFNVWRDLYLYDGNNVIQNHTSEVWMGSDWGPSSQEDYTYDANGNLETVLSQYYDGSQWINTFLQSFEWSQLTGIEDENSAPLPASFSLGQNYPNPFNPSTTISFTVPKNGHVKVTVYNVIGQEMARLINSEVKAGTHTVTFNASGLTSGVYLYKIETNGFTSVRKMMLIK